MYTEKLLIVEGSLGKEGMFLLFVFRIIFCAHMLIDGSIQLMYEVNNNKATS